MYGKEYLVEMELREFYRQRRQAEDLLRSQLSDDALVRLDEAEPATDLLNSVIRRQEAAFNRAQENALVTGTGRLRSITGGLFSGGGVI